MPSCLARTFGRSHWWGSQVNPLPAAPPFWRACAFSPPVQSSRRRHFGATQSRSPLLQLRATMYTPSWCDGRLLSTYCVLRTAVGHLWSPWLFRGPPGSARDMDWRMMGWLDVVTDHLVFKMEGASESILLKISFFKNCWIFPFLSVYLNSS